MAERTPQTYANHTRFDPPFHFFLLPVAAITIGLSVFDVIRRPGFRSAWYVVLALAFAILIFLTRTYALKAQDRVIRLEERLRLSGLLGEPLRSRIPELTEGQLIALRFAADNEVVGLVETCLSAGAKPADIKKAIRNWRPDYFRI
ncbi:MAG: DUF6526 family protein [Bryobacteraceae bacterium]|jgi:hypothetical protein